MNDDDILAAGGTQEDIDCYAETHGAPQPNQYEDRELQEAIIDIVSDVYVKCRQNHSLSGVTQTHTNQIMQLITQKQLEARIDEAETTGRNILLGLTVGTAHQIYDARIAELKKELQ